MFIYFLFQNFGRGNCGVGCVGVGVVRVTYLGNMIGGVKYWLDTLEAWFVKNVRARGNGGERVHKDGE